MLLKNGTATGLLCTLLLLGNFGRKKRFLHNSSKKQRQCYYEAFFCKEKLRIGEFISQILYSVHTVCSCVACKNFSPANFVTDNKLQYSSFSRCNTKVHASLQENKSFKFINSCKTQSNKVTIHMVKFC